MEKPKQAWMVRAGNDNELADQVEDKNAVAIGWAGMGDLSGLHKREEFKERYRQTYPDHSDPRVNVNTGQVYRFAREIHGGDYVLTYDKANREILIGTIVGDFSISPSMFSDDYPFIRKVNWLKRISRDEFSAPARNSLGGILTVFQVSDHIDEIYAKATGTYVKKEIIEEVAETPPFYEETKAKADELISDMVSKLDSYEFQDLVAGVLTAMGYRSISHPPGRDRGVDVVAYPDALGFERPRIKAQVKHRKGKATGPEMRSFIGVLREGDNGLFVSTGDFTDDAKLDVEQSRERVTMLNRDGFIQLLLEFYEVLAPEFQALVPLKRIWLPLE